MLYIQKLSTVTQNELQAVGNRAIDLALLQQNQIPTAASFVVLSSAFEEFMHVNSLKYKIDYILSHAQENIQASLVNAYNGARKAMLEAKFPAGFETELRATYESITTPLAVGDLVAANDRAPVRIIMSLNRHDDPENNDTVIQNVNGFEELLVGIREAWALAYHPSQLGARMKDKFPESRLKIALLVQTMDRPTASCAAYSCLPQDHHKIYLQVYSGYPDLREKISKDFYAIGKENLRVIATQTGRQQHQLERNDAKELVVVPMATRFELNDRDVVEIARLTKKAERALKSPVKAFFVLTESMPELLWVNRLGFEIMIKDEEAPAASTSAPAKFPWMHEMTPMPIVPAPQAPAEQVTEQRAPQPEPVEQAPTAEELIEESKAEAPASEQADFLLAEQNAAQAEPASPVIEQSASIVEVVSEPATVPPAVNSPAMDVRSGVAAKLLNASLRIVRQIVERKYRATFSETPATENLADMINRLNEASVFSRAVDGALLLQADEAARSEAKISEVDYAKTIEEVAYLMTYA